MADSLLEEIRAALAEDKVAATTRFDEVRPIDIEDVMTCNALGDLYGRAGKPERAYVFYQRAAQLYRADGYSTKAIAILRKATRLETAPPEALWELGGLYALEGFKAEASQQYLRYAELQRRRDDTNAVLRAYEKIVELDPDNHLIRVVLAEMYSKSGFDSRAGEEYERALELLDPESDAADVARVKKRLLELDRHAAEEEDINLPEELVLPTPEGPIVEESALDEPLIRDEPSDEPSSEESADETTIDLGEHEGDEAPEEPAIDLEKAVEALSEESEDFDLADMESEPDPAEDVSAVSETGKTTGDEAEPVRESTFEEVVEDFKEAMSSLTAGDDPQGHYDLGIAYKEMGMLDDAILHLQAAARHEFLRNKAAGLLGDCFYEKGLPELTVKEFERALRSSVDEDERLSLHYRLAVVLEELGRIDEARDNLLECYAIDINYHDVARRLERLG